MCVTHREKACSINSCVPSGYNFLSFFFAVSPSKGNSSVHMLQLFVFTTIEDIESEKETAVVFHHDGTPPPPVNPLQSCVSTCKVSIREVKEADQQPGLKVFHVSNR